MKSGETKEVITEWYDGLYFHPSQRAFDSGGAYNIERLHLHSLLTFLNGFFSKTAGLSCNHISYFAFWDTGNESLFNWF